MTKRSAQHGTIRLERRFKAPPNRVFAAWAEPEARATAAAKDTHLLLTEQIAFLDGQDNAANREEGLASMLDKIGKTL